jgi:CRISPR-associated endonuclease Cas1
MQTKTNPPTKHGIATAHGYGIKVHVYRRHLVIEDGIGHDRRARRYHRTSKLRRLVIVGRTGYITFEAVRWLLDVGAALVHIDADGQLLATSIQRGRNLPALRRAQALAPTSAAGLQVARQLLQTKVAGQLSLLPELPEGEHARPEIDRALTGIEAGTTHRDLLDAEARAAAAYWGAWASLRVSIATRGRQQEHSIPEHWRAFGQRHSLITGGPRTATNPANAMLNYLYALLEAETTLACWQIGLDPGLGIFHTDRPDRDSLALDLMEATRPAVDAYVLGLLVKRTLSALNFAETRQGACRLTQTMAASLALTTAAWREHAAPHVERVAYILGGDGSRASTATPLTRANNLAAWDRRAPQRRHRQSRAGALALPNTCRDCGAYLPTRRHRYCESCRKRRWELNASRGRRTAAQTLAALKAEQRDPGHGGRAAELRGSKNEAHQRAVHSWTGDRPPATVFTAEILPKLREVSIAELVDATRLSKHYCSLIRLGKRVPHPRHWAAFRQLTEETQQAEQPLPSGLPTTPSVNMAGSWLA